MGDQAEIVKHNVNLSSQVWGELKFRAFQEKTTASELIDSVVQEFLKGQPVQVKVSRYQARHAEPRLGRSVFFHVDVWEGVQRTAGQANVSVSGLIEYLMKVYLGLLPGEESIEDQIEANPQRYVQMGNDVIDLGENPVQIDWKTGKPPKSE